MSSKSWDARAAAFERRTADELDELHIPPPRQYASEIRYYLQRMTDTDQTKNGAHLVKTRSGEPGETVIDVGPTVFREPCDDCVLFKSGAKLSFGITLRQDAERTRLLAYRFYLQLLPTSGLRFIRIDLNRPKDNYDQLQQPRSHMHHGFGNVHFPYPVMSPIEVLDRIFEVIEPAFTR